MQLLLWKGYSSMKKTLTLAAVLVTAALFSVGVSPAQAAPVADQTQSGLTGTNIQASILQMGPTVIGTTDIGSSFTAGLSGQLTSIEVQTSAYSAGFPAHDAEARVWIVDGAGLPTGTALATATIPVASLNPTGTLTITFATPATVTAGTNYAFTIGFVEQTGAMVSQLTFPTGIAPAGKHFISLANGTPGLHSPYGINFTTYVESVAPEDPSDEEPPSGASDEELADTGANASAVVALAPLGAMVLLAGALIVRRRLVSHR
jgi:hypothetical protein